MGNPAKPNCLKDHGPTVRCEPLDPTVTTHNARYLRVKRDQLGQPPDFEDDEDATSATRSTDRSTTAEHQRQSGA